MKFKTHLLRHSLFAIMALGLVGCAQSTRPGVDHMSAHYMTSTATVHYKYLLYLPKDYAQKDQWPLLLFLHGSGERGTDLKLVEKNGPPKLITAGKEFPFIVVSPQCPKGELWDPYKLATLVDEIAAKYKVDKDRIYATGLSQGGFGCWYLAAYYPNLLAAIAPVCGGGDPDMAKRFSKLAIWSFHGAKDPLVPVERAQQMQDAMNKVKNPFKLTIYPDAGHDAWTATYDNPELYTWLLEQKRVPQPPPEVATATAPATAPTTPK